MKYAYVYPKGTMKHILEEMSGQSVNIGDDVRVSALFTAHMWEQCGTFHKIPDDHNHRLRFASYVWDPRWYKVVDISKKISFINKIRGMFRR